MGYCKLSKSIPQDNSTSVVEDTEFLSRQQKTISKLSAFFLQSKEDEKLYGILSGWVTEVLHLEGCLILEKLDSSPEFKLYSACGFCDFNRLELTGWVDNQQLRDTLHLQKPVVVPDFQVSDHYKAPDRECFKEFRSSMSVPIPGDKGPRGLLAVYHLNPRKFTVQELDFLMTISNMLAGALASESRRRELLKSEARSKAILDTAVDGIITIDTKGEITLFNQAAQQIFGYSEAEVIGENIRILMPEPYHSEHDGYLHSYQTSGEKKIMGSGREVTGRRKDGTTFPMYLAVSESIIDEQYLFTGIVRDITRQRRLEQEVLKISDHERRRIGQDLHDGLGQMLTGIGLLSRGLENALTRDGSPAAGQAAEITRLLREADQYARNLSRGLLPVDFDGHGLVASLRRLAGNAERLFGITCTFMETRPPVFHDNSVVEHLFRIAQEAISNAVKHGLAGKVQLHLYSDEQFAVLHITDDGKGFPDNWERDKGSGLDIMQFRAQLIGARLEIQNRMEGGVELKCLLPRSESLYQIDQDLS